MRRPTVRGYDFLECASALQKAIRRADARVAGYFALELWSSGYGKYVWKRLLTVSAEDCHGPVTQEIVALHDAFMAVNDGKPSAGKGRIFISKAVIVLCTAGKSRDADHLQNFLYDRDMLGPAEKRDATAGAEAADASLAELIGQDTIPIPDYAFDVHTRRGRAKGKTKAEFFREEQAALQPRVRGLFDDLVD